MLSAFLRNALYQFWTGFPVIVSYTAVIIIRENNKYVTKDTKSCILSRNCVCVVFYYLYVLMLSLSVCVRNQMLIKDHVINHVDTVLQVLKFLFPICDLRTIVCAPLL